MSIRKLYIELTSGCNLNCAICYRRAWTGGKADLPRAAFDALAAFARRSPSLKTVVLGGIGEPTVSPLFREALETFADKAVTVTTNGVDLSSGVLEDLAAYASTVVFSVDGLSAAFKEIRGTPLDSVVAAVRALGALRAGAGREAEGALLPRIELQFVLSDRNAQDLAGVADLAADLGAEALTVSHLLPQDEESADRILYGRCARDDARTLFDRVRVRAMRRGLNLILPPIELKTERRCAFAEDDAAYVDAAGDLVPCYRLSHDGTEFVLGRKKTVYKHRFGNVAEAEPEEIWESRSYADFRAGLIANRYPSCPDCDLVDGCSLTLDTGADCWSGAPSCADCLWARGFMRCP